jgi:hypothetical protein
MSKIDDPYFLSMEYTAQLTVTRLGVAGLVVSGDLALLAS